MYKGVLQRLCTKFEAKGKQVEGRKDAKVQQDESYHFTGDLAALNTSCLTGFQPDTHRVPYSHVVTGPAPDSRVSTGVCSVSRPCVRFYRVGLSAAVTPSPYDLLFLTISNGRSPVKPGTSVRPRKPVITTTSYLNLGKATVPYTW